MLKQIGVERFIRAVVGKRPLIRLVVPGPGINEAKDIDSLKRQINNNKDFMDNKRKEQEEIRQKFALDIERYRELKSKQ